MSKHYKLYEYFLYKNKLLEILKLDNDNVKKIYDKPEYILADEKYKKYQLYRLLVEMTSDRDVLGENKEIFNIVKEADNILPRNTFVEIGKSPEIFKFCNLDINRYLKIDRRNLIKSQSKDEDHTISDEGLMNILSYIENPICITTSNAPDIYSFILDLKSENDLYAMALISSYDNENNGTFINIVDSIYGKKSISQYIQNHNIIAYHNKKMNDLLTELGLQLPLYGSTKSFTYDGSIAEKGNIVND